MRGPKTPRKERTPIIEKSRLAYQEFLDDDQVKAAIERIISSTWEQAVNTCALVLESRGKTDSAAIIRGIRSPE